MTTSERGKDDLRDLEHASLPKWLVGTPGSPVLHYCAIAHMEAIKNDIPSWKGEVKLQRTCYEPFRSWCAEVQDVWGHMSTPIFWGKSAEQVLRGLDAWLMKIYESEDPPYVDDDGVAFGCDAEVYLEPNPKDVQP